MIDEGETENVWCWGCSQDWFENHCPRVTEIQVAFIDAAADCLVTAVFRSTPEPMLAIFNTAA